MADSATDARAIEETASETPRRVRDGETPVINRAGDDARLAPPERLADSNPRPSAKTSAVSGEEFLEAVKAHHRANWMLRASERRESDNPTPADMISEMRDERDEQILSAALGIYD